MRLVAKIDSRTEATGSRSNVLYAWPSPCCYWHADMRPNQAHRAGPHITKIGHDVDRVRVHPRELAWLERVPGLALPGDGSGLAYTIRGPVCSRRHGRLTRRVLGVGFVDVFLDHIVLAISTTALLLPRYRHLDTTATAWFIWRTGARA